MPAFVARECRGGQEVLVLGNDLLRCVLWPARGGDVVELIDAATGLDAIWKRPGFWPPNEQTNAAVRSDDTSPEAFFAHWHGGWSVSLPQGFHPSAWPDAGGERFGIHGEFQFLAAKAVVLSASQVAILPEAEPGEMAVQLTLRGQRSSLTLVRTFRLAPGRRRLRLDQELRSHADRELPFVWQEHPCFGGPLIDGARLHIPAQAVWVPDGPDAGDDAGAGELLCRGLHAWPDLPLIAGGVRDARVIPAAGSGIRHCVCATKLRAGWASLFNDALSLGVGIAFDAQRFPWLWTWLSDGAADGAPCYGQCRTATLQPATSAKQAFPQLLAAAHACPTPRHADAASGLARIAAGECIRTSLRVGFLAAPDEAAAW